ncbi:hypothetical protein ACFLX2_00555 [Candidatus Dependentiae bacterium]
MSKNLIFLGAICLLLLPCCCVGMRARASDVSSGQNDPIRRFYTLAQQMERRHAAKAFPVCRSFWNRRDIDDPLRGNPVKICQLVYAAYDEAPNDPKSIQLCLCGDCWLDFAFINDGQFKVPLGLLPCDPGYEERLKRIGQLAQESVRESLVREKRWNCLRCFGQMCRSLCKRRGE